MGVTLFQIEERSFKRALQVALTTVYSGRGDDVREVFRFVKFRFYKFMKFRSYKGNVSVVSTDSFRMSRTWLGVTPTNGEGAFLVHYGKIRKLVRLLHGNSKEMVTFSVSDDEREVMVSSSRFEWNGGLWNNSYPDERMCIPWKYTTEIVIPGHIVKKIIRGCKSVLGKYGGVTWDIDIERNKVEFIIDVIDTSVISPVSSKGVPYSASHTDKDGNLCIPINCVSGRGESLRLKLNIEFVLNFLRLVGKRNVTVSLVDAKSAVKFYDGYGEYNYTVMPMTYMILSTYDKR